MKKARLFLTLILFSFACYCSPHYAEYKIALKNVDCLNTPENDQSEKKIILFQEEGDFKSAFEDEKIKIIWTPTPSRFLFIITNKTQDTMKITWEQAEYIDENGTVKKVMHSAMIFSGENGSRLPTAVARDSSVSGFILPTDNVYWLSGDMAGWRKKPLFPYYNRTSADDLMVEAKEYEGKSIQVLLPVDVKNSLYNYRFTFKISDVALKE